jgi:hypothetical protein
MNEQPRLTSQLHGMYRDVLRAPSGRVLFDSEWKKNAIVVDCHRLLAAFVRGGAAGQAPPTNAPAFGIQGILLGAGLDSWDNTTASAQPTDATLTDPNPFFFPRTDPNFKIDFLDTTTNAVVGNATTKLQIVATLGPNTPNWPDGGPHPTGTMREFGLVGKIDGYPGALPNNQVLINYVKHPAIAKDPGSTLERTIWLTF